MSPGALRADQAPADVNGGAQYGPVTMPVGTPTRPDGAARVVVLPTDRYTMLFLSASGLATMTPTAALPPNYPPFTAGPTGTSGCGWGLIVTLDSGGSYATGWRGAAPGGACGSNTTEQGYVVTRGIVSARRDPGGGYVCGPARNQPCFTASGDFTVTAWAPRAALSLSASRYGSTPVVSAGDQYSFTVVITPNQIDGQGVPRYVRSWRFVEDGTGRVVVPSCGTATTCNFDVQRSGRMQVSAWVNADSLTADFPIQLGPVGLTLTPSRSSVAAGDSVTFTPAATPAGAPLEVLSWSWQPDSGAAVTVCGTNPTCTLAVPRSGTMKVNARVQGVTLAATAPVTVVRCPTGDPLLNLPQVRDSLKAAIGRSTNPNPRLRKEYGGMIVRRANGSIDIVPIADPGATDCHWSPSPPNLAVGDSLLAWYHTHPHAASDSAYGCTDRRGRPLNRWVQVAPTTNGGGSDADWAFASDSSWGPRPVYVMSDHGEVIRLEPGVQPSQRAANPNRWWWKANPTPGGCNW